MPRPAALLILFLLTACAGGAAGRHAHPPPKPDAIFGTWALLDGSHTVMRVTPAGLAVAVEAWATDTGVHYDVTGVSWDGHRLRATFRYPPTGITTTSDLVLINSDRLEGTVTGAYRARETWLRAEPAKPS